MKLRIFLTNLFMPFIKLISKLGKPEPRRTYSDVLKIVSLIEPGDILLSREDWRLSNLFITGFWSHAAQYLLDGVVIEAIPPRVREINITEFILSADSVCLLRPKYKINFTDYRSQFVGIDYDYGFMPDNKLMFCSELVREYQKLIAEDMKQCLDNKFTVVPEDFYKSDKFTILFEER